MDEFEKACKQGDFKSVIQLIKTNTYNWNHGLSYACYGGNIKIVKLMIANKATNLDTGLSNAGLKRHLKVVKLLITHRQKLLTQDPFWIFSNKCEFTWNLALACACQGGNMKIVKLIIEKGTPELKYYLRELDWNYGLINAIVGKHADIAKLMFKKGATDWHCASTNPEREIIKRIIKENPKKRDNMKEYLIEKSIISYHSKISVSMIMIKDMRKELCKYINY